VVTGEKTGVLVKPERCTGCRVCELECSFLYHKAFNPALSHIKILETPESGISYEIKFTEDCRPKCVACVKSCVFGALEIEEGEG
jgi:Fe-S-cluster-containing dehydrogenase component